MPAADQAPNATTRMMSVTGSESSPAFSRSSRTPWSASTVLASPNSPMKSCGWSCCSASTRRGRDGSFNGRVRVAADVEARRARRACPERPDLRSPGSSGERTCWTTPSVESLRRRRDGRPERRASPRAFRSGSGRSRRRAAGTRRRGSVHAPGIARPGRVGVDGLHADHAAEPEGDDDQREPAERRGFQWVGVQRPMRAAMLDSSAWCGTCLSSSSSMLGLRAR